MSVNKIMLVGHLGNDPEKRATTSGAVVTAFPKEVIDCSAQSIKLTIAYTRTK